MTVTIDTILELDKLGKCELLVLNEKEYKVGEEIELIHKSSFGAIAKKRARIDKVLPNYASSTTIKYFNLFLSAI